MKIEVCELLISSWLKFIKGCQIVQTNWTPSPLYQIKEADLSTVASFTNEVKSFMSDTDIDIFKQSTVQQLIGQCEIDVVGLKILDGNVDELYFVDSAFHEAGLCYNNTTATVVKKILRAIIVSDVYFKNIPAQMVFVSPFARKSVSAPIQAQLDKLQSLVVQYYPDMTITMLFNEEFARDIYIPLKQNIGKLNNDNDLFLRSIKLINLCDEFVGKDENSSQAANIVSRDINTERTKRGDNEKKVFCALNMLINNNLMTEEMVEQLKNATYTKENFNMPTFPFLITIEDFKQKGYQRSRFYKNTIYIRGVHYFVCSQWIPERIRCLDKWIEKSKQH